MASDQQPPEIFDSLPYYDNDLENHPNLKELVEKEFRREPKPPNVLHPKLQPALAPFENHPLLKTELDRAEANQPIPPLDMHRYQLPVPSGPNATEEEWTSALQNARAQLEHQQLRQTNIALLQNYGANSWKVHNYLLEAEVNIIEKEAEKLQEAVTDVNRERKNNQTLLGNQLTALETRWTELISEVLQIELANVALEAEIEQLEARESELTAVG
ncbi:breast carcinoma amplified sequence 2 [Sistotremastrum suecicum HHB10207 ss-3]|uniref:Breast carcinoma amplified sequence 2 n=1 Tax=Sistotremastrum suecicum HHB10207 ss-3 TaxID=1314776 RepID=A0A166IPD6_9AGAM|nr:breast carcinoma amplified sequence 2 [Sistotremastrum suecicum HHB10207 ss-3]